MSAKQATAARYAAGARAAIESAMRDLATVMGEADPLISSMVESSWNTLRDGLDQLEGIEARLT